MTLVHWEPFREIGSLQKEVSGLFDSFSPSGLSNDDFEQLSFVPAAEMNEIEEVIDLKLEIPGLEAKDLDVSFLIFN